MFQYECGGSHGSSGGTSRVAHPTTTGCPNLTAIMQDALLRWRQLNDEIVDQQLIRSVLRND